MNSKETQVAQEIADNLTTWLETDEGKAALTQLAQESQTRENDKPKGDPNIGDRTFTQ